MKTLRKLSENLLHYDAMTFYSGLLALQAASIHQLTPSMWLTTASADMLFTKSKARVFTLSRIPSDRPEEEAPSRQIEKSLDIDIEMVPKLEVPPKAGLLSDVIREIKETIYSLKGEGSKPSGSGEFSCSDYLGFIEPNLRVY